MSKLPEGERLQIFRVIDALIRDYKAKKAYASYIVKVMSDDNKKPSRPSTRPPIPKPAPSGSPGTRRQNQKPSPLERRGVGSGSRPKK